MSALHAGIQQRWTAWRATPGWPAALLILVQITNGMRDTPTFAFFLIYLQEQIKLAPAAISGVVAGAQAASMIAALLGGVLTARLGSKWVLAGGLMLAGLTSLVFQVHTMWLVVALWLIGGAGSALMTVGGASLLTRLTGRGALGMLSALYVLSITMGGAIGNPIAGVLIEQRGFGIFGWAATGLAIIAVVIVAVLLPSQRDQSVEPVSARSFLALAVPAVRSAQARLLIVMRALPTIFYGMMLVLIPLLLNNLTGSKVTVAAYGTATLVVASISQLLAGRAADRWGARLPTLVGYSALIIAGLGLAVTAGTVWGLFVFGVIGVAAAWSLSAMMYVWVADGVPKADHPATFGMLHAVWSLSMIGGSVLGGWLVLTAPGLPFLLAGLFNAGSLFLTFAYYRSRG